MEEHSIAYECIQEVKRSNDRLEKSSKRWFALTIIELIIILAMVISYFVYESQYSYELEEDTTQTIEDVNTENSNINQSIGE